MINPVQPASTHLAATRLEYRLALALLGIVFLFGIPLVETSGDAVLTSVAGEPKIAGLADPAGADDRDTLLLAALETESDRHVR